CLQSKDFPYTF
nr:immunoglobulin light chain junction region [Macaca mulatta]MOY10417.1 immunoglobulin light chain junction region [Macaca mulatta]MOY10505.1 immunoglobulin light chain junction region [Macaca mulatta]MOY10559.1 immunoglobulin light chain junction region [Macaca mulatta]MOY10577.1 immunoglobulin light chain junction region [Macaca mulatta]